MSSNNLLQPEEIVPYLELKQDEFLDLSSDILDYCQDNNPLILKYGNIHDLIEIFSKYLDFENPFILQEDDLSSSDEDTDDT